jgi:hypothetical protein
MRYGELAVVLSAQIVVNLWWIVVICVVLAW